MGRLQTSGLPRRYASRVDDVIQATLVGQDAGITEKLRAEVGQRVTLTAAERVASGSACPLVIQPRHIDAAQSQDVATAIVDDRCRAGRLLVAAGDCDTGTVQRLKCLGRQLAGTFRVNQ